MAGPPLLVDSNPQEGLPPDIGLWIAGCLAGLRDCDGAAPAVRIPLSGDAGGHAPRIPSVAVAPTSTPERGYSTTATRTLVVDASEDTDNIVVWLVGSIGIVGLAVMLAIDVLVYSAF